MHSATLHVRDSKGRRTVNIGKPVFTIGRRRDRDLVVEGVEVSREHAVIRRSADALVLRDTSRLGTFVNGTQVTECELHPGDAVRLGRGGGADLLLLAEDGIVPEYSWTTTTAVRDLQHVATLLDGLRAIGAARVLDDVLALVLDSALEISGAERGFIMLADDRRELQLTQARGAGRQTLAGPFATSQRIPSEVYASGLPRFAPDLRVESPVENARTMDLRIRSVLCLPLRLVRRVARADDAAEEKRIGVLYLDSQEPGALLSGPRRMALETLATEAAQAIENARLYRAALEKAALERELRIAAEIQQALMPRATRTGTYFEAASATLPCRSIGGDFFDYVHGAPWGLRFVLGDVAGKGPPAALLSALVQGMLAQTALETPMSETVSRINLGLLERAIEARFVTLFCARLAPTGALVYCNGGHNPPLVVGAGGVRRLTTGGPVVGMFEGAKFEQDSVVMAPGDWVVAFSDGLSEARNAREDEFGESRILDTVSRHLGDTADVMVASLLDDVERFSVGVPQLDDITVLAVRYEGA